MTCHIKSPNELKTTILLPASKSVSNRVLLLNALSAQPGILHNIALCDDTEVVIKAISNANHTIDIGAAGTAMRFLTAYFAGQNGSYTITGSDRMKNRPIKQLVDALHAAGAQIDYAEKEGYPPLHIKGGTLTGGEIQLDGGVSSQYISALLMIAPTMTNGLRLHLTGSLISQPYVRLTIELMRRFGVVVFEEGQTYTIPPQPYRPIDDFTVESDWSAASYWYEMVALSSDRDAVVSLSGLKADSLQGDASIVKLFDSLGVKTTFTPDGATLTKKVRSLRPPNADRSDAADRSASTFTFDFVSMPDMAQTVAVTCAMLDIPFRFTGLQSLKIKETDRLHALRTELCKLGYTLYITDGNTLEWKGERDKSERDPVIATYEDHRMAMAFAPVALCRKDGIRIAHPEVVSKSYPSYWDDLQKAGFGLSDTDRFS
jgi:3-phosphoshikimate 1-carboxyvinyltransferase